MKQADGLLLSGSSLIVTSSERAIRRRRHERFHLVLCSEELFSSASIFGAARLAYMKRLILVLFLFAGHLAASRAESFE